MATKYLSQFTSPVSKLVRFFEKESRGLEGETSPVEADLQAAPEPAASGGEES